MVKFFVVVCILGVIGILAKAVDGLMNWYEHCPVKEEKETPRYVVRTYKEIKESYDNEQ